MSTVDHVTRITTAEPEQRLCAAMLIDAMESCRRGCGESCQWLNTFGADYLLVIANDWEDVDVLIAKLLPVAPVQLMLGMNDVRRQEQQVQQGAV